ncbi:TetR/AcrR family transcriptional regulator [Streptomyces sp. NPDC047928]|uniref:TetR/AcrR family transcriptional regulator n=1 Tax=unclassified Streptomyces TaxID=2593676 RepID=UPI0037116518
MAKETRERMIDAAVDALRRRGLAGMSFTDVLAASGAARGAIYHHFPGGKNQLVAEAAARNGQDVRARLTALPGAGAAGPREVAEAFIAFARPVAEEAAGGSGCAVAAVTLPADGDGRELCQVASGVFGSWTERLTEALTAAGMAPDAAADSAHLLVSLLEGAQVLCRAAATAAPFDHASRAALSLFPEAPEPPGRPGRV